MTAGPDAPEDQQSDAADSEGDQASPIESEGTGATGDEPVGRSDEADRARPGTDVEAEQWRYSVDEVGEADEDGDEGNVAGILMRGEPLESQPIDVENAAFFLLGALGTIAFVFLAITGI